MFYLIIHTFVCYRIFIRYNEIGPALAQVVATMLIGNSTMTELSLTCVFKFVAFHFDCNVVVCHLFLLFFFAAIIIRGNGIDDTGAQALAVVLICNTAIAMLYLEFVLKCCIFLVGLAIFFSII